MLRFFFSFCAVVMSLLVLAQDQTITYPYNPDADSNNNIGSPDLLDFLGIFGEEFQPEEIMIDNETLYEVIAQLQEALLNQSGGSNSSHPCQNETSLNYLGIDYPLVEIGDQCWFGENLNVTQYANGDDINGTTSSGVEGLEVYYPDTVNYYAHQSGFYSCLVAADERNVCPTGYHIPTWRDWTELASFLGPSRAGYLLKDSLPWGGPNDYGFSARPIGVLSVEVENDIENYDQCLSECEWNYCYQTCENEIQNSIGAMMDDLFEFHDELLQNNNEIDILCSLIMNDQHDSFRNVLSDLFLLNVTIDTSVDYNWYSDIFQVQNFDEFLEMLVEDLFSTYMQIVFNPDVNTNEVCQNGADFDGLGMEVESQLYNYTLDEQFWDQIYNCTDVCNDTADVNCNDYCGDPPLPTLQGFYYIYSNARSSYHVGVNPELSNALEIVYENAESWDLINSPRRVNILWNGGENSIYSLSATMDLEIEGSQLYQFSPIRCMKD